MPFKIHIKAETDEVVKEELRTVAEIIVGLRESTKKYREHFHPSDRKDMERYQQKADQWIDRHKIVYKEKK